jgi:hypothetical protein
VKLIIWADLHYQSNRDSETALTRSLFSPYNRREDDEAVHYKLFSIFSFPAFSR